MIYGRDLLLSSVGAGHTIFRSLSVLCPVPQLEVSSQEGKVEATWGAHKDGLEPTWKGVCPDLGAFFHRSKPTPGPGVAEAKGGELAGAGIGHYAPCQPGGRPMSGDAREYHGASRPPQPPEYGGFWLLLHFRLQNLMQNICGPH